MDARSRLPVSLFLLTVFAAGCQVAEHDNRFERLANRRAAQWDQLKVMKAATEWRDLAPVTFRFPGKGEVMVRRWHLEGGPGWEYVRARFTYKNTTDQRMDRVRILFAVEDDRGGQVSASYVDLIHPWGFTLNPGTTFSEEIKVPTNGAHWRHGWRWVVDCEALRDADVPY